MANPSREAIAEALRQTFPNAPDKAEELAVLITQALNNEIDATEAEARFSALSQALPDSLAGKTATGPAALVNFGAGSSLGDLTVGDIAGGNMVKLFVGQTTFQINIGGQDKETAEPIRPRIFICHTEADRALFEQIQQKLEAAGFEVLPDPAQQRNNAYAQRTQFLWMGLAHAAVLLVSENALQSAEFVTATRLLTGRYLLRLMNNDPFRLLCVLLDGLQAANLQEHNPALANLEVTFVDIPGAGTAADLAQVPGATLAALQDLTESELPETVLEKLARQISDELANARPPVLKNTAQALGLRILHNESDESIRRKVSAGLWYAKVDEWDKVMRELVTDTQKVNTRRLIELVFPSWVNPWSARCLLDVAGERALRRAIVVNGEMTEFVSRSFVRRAYYLSDNPKLQRPIITINTWNDTNRDAVQVIREQIIEKLLKPLSRAEMSEEEFTRKLARELRRGPVFVVLDPLPDRGALHKIVSAFPFPGLVFFMLSGSQPFPPDLPDALALEPALREFEDQDAYDLYTEWQA